MRVEPVETEQLARHGAAHVAAVLRAAVVRSGRATVAFSGGSNAGPLLAALGEIDVPWQRIHVLQVDERVVPDEDDDRNLAILLPHLDRAGLPPEHLHAMPVTEPDLEAAAARYARVLETLAGTPPALDLVHLGLGEDGHTASLVPGSALLDERERPVAVTEPSEGRRRMTLTLPVLSRAHRVLWLASGARKAAAVRRFLDGDSTIPAGRVERSRARLLIDTAAAATTSQPPRQEQP